MPQTLSLGGAGAYDAVVISGILAVLLSELIGEIAERMARGRRGPDREYSIESGEFLRKGAGKMKRLWILLLLLAVFAVPARAEMDGDGVYTLYDDQGNELTMRAGRMFVGDEYISGDDRLYRVASVDDAQKTARAEYIGPAA